MKAFVINLPQHKEKLEFIRDQLASKNITDYEIVKGVDGNLLTDEVVATITDQDQSIRYIKRPLAKTEIGCALSHLLVYKEIISKNLPLAIIFEDDALFLDMFDIESLSPLIQDYEVILVGASTHHDSLREGDILECINKTEEHHVFGTFAYLITQAGAIKLREHFSKINYPIDSWTILTRSGVKIGILKPLLVTVNTSFVSYIADERSQLRKKFIYDKLN
jgi:glycosyl transferase family 25